MIRAGIFAVVLAVTAASGGPAVSAVSPNVAVARNPGGTPDAAVARNGGTPTVAVARNRRRAPDMAVALNGVTWSELSAEIFPGPFAGWNVGRS